MARTVDELETEIRALSAGERMHLLRDLIADLDGESEPDVERAWLEEAERRYSEIRDGVVEPIPAEEVFAQARAKIRK
jgi:putative addiction module component (TIGR02574 family)